MEVKEVRCYNKEKNEFRFFNEHIVDERFQKSTGYVLAPEPKEPEIAVCTDKICTPTAHYSGLQSPIDAPKELLCEEVKNTRGRKRKQK